MNLAGFLLAEGSEDAACAWCQSYPCLASLSCWGIVAGALGLLLMLPGGWKRGRYLGVLLGCAGLGLLAADLPWFGDLAHQVFFWLLAGTALVAAVIAISVRSPIYTAIWFAISLLGVAGLFLYQEAPFLGVVTIAVYAGAIVVTFLFVLMLAQPAGHTVYDRVSWGWLPKPFAVIAAAALTGLMTFAVASLPSTAPIPTADPIAGDTATSGAPDHMANLGNTLFGTHLVSVEVAGTLLLVALVGAIAIVIHGKQPQLPNQGVEGARNDE